METFGERRRVFNEALYITAWPMRQELYREEEEEREDEEGGCREMSGVKHPRVNILFL